MAHNNDACGQCSAVTYQVPVDQSTRNFTRLSDGRAVLHTDPLLALNYTNQGQTVNKHSNRCKTYYIRQGCTADKLCSGTTQVTVRKTAFPEVRSFYVVILILFACMNIQNKHHTDTGLNIYRTLQVKTRTYVQQEALQTNVELNDGSSLAHLRRTIYWSDVAQGEYGLFRCYLHVNIDDIQNGTSTTDKGFLESPANPSCTQVERILSPSSGVQEKVRDLTVVPVQCDLGPHGAVQVSATTTANECDMLYFLDARTNAVWRLLIPALSAGNVYDHTHSNPLYVFPSSVPLQSNDGSGISKPTVASEVGVPVKVRSLSSGLGGLTESLQET